MDEQSRNRMAELLFMQSGMMDNPNTGGNPWASFMDPNERAAARLRAPYSDRVQLPQGAPYVQTPAELGQSALEAAPMIMPLGPIAGAVGKAVTSAPRLAAALMAGGTLAAGTSQAGENPFNWVDPDKARTEKLNAFNQTMNNLNREMRAASKARMPSVEKQMDTLIKERDALLAQQAKDREAAFVTWQGEQQAAREAAELKRRQETSWFDTIPGLRSAIVPAAGAASYLGGSFLGKRLPTGRAMAAGSAGGGMEGALSQLLPTEMDVAGLPRGAPAQVQASSDLRDPAYWARVLASTAGGAGLGAYGAFKSSMGRRDALPRISSPQPSPGGPMPTQPMPPTAPTRAPGSLPTSAGPTASNSAMAEALLRDPSKGVRYPGSGRVYYEDGSYLDSAGRLFDANNRLIR